MKIGLLYPPIVASRSEMEKGFAGRRTDLYQKMLSNLVEQAKLADELGFYGIGFTEHHLHVEGMTLSTSPGMLNLLIGLSTKRIMVGALGYVLPAHNPLRVAEEIAMLDQMTQGRAFGGFARGIQARWVNIYGQQFPALADNMTDPDAYNAVKRELYDESIDIILKAWTEDLFSYQGKHWQVPVPNINWAAAQFSRDLGGGIDENGRVVEVGIAPAPYQKPYPELFEPFTASSASIRYCASRGLIPLGIMTHKETVRDQMEAAQEGWKERGRDCDLGEGFGLTRYVIVADTDEEARALAEDALWEWTYFFSMFNFQGVLLRPGENLADLSNSMETLIERNMLFCGSPDTVCEQLEKAFRDLPCEYLWVLSQNELVPQKAALRSLELMATQVFPRLGHKMSGEEPVQC